MRLNLADAERVAGTRAGPAIRLPLFLDCEGPSECYLISKVRVRRWLSQTPILLEQDRR